MANNKNNKKKNGDGRECVTFWGVVGANFVTSGIVFGATVVVGLIGAGIIAAQAADRTLEGLARVGAIPPPPPPPGG